MEDQKSTNAMPIDPEPEVVGQDKAAKAREAARKRKQAQRARDKQKVIAAQATTLQKFWQANQAVEPKLVELEARHDEVVLLHAAMLDYMNHTLEETGTTLDDLADTVAEVQADVAKHGTVLLEVALVPFFEQDERAFYHKVQARGGATAVFARLGLLTALPQKDTLDFLNRFAPQQSIPLVDRLCSGCGKKTMGAANLADAYCDRCTELRHERAQADLAKIRGFQKTVAQNIKTCDTVVPFDAFGRAKVD